MSARSRSTESSTVWVARSCDCRRLNPRALPASATPKPSERISSEWPAAGTETTIATSPAAITHPAARIAQPIVAPSAATPTNVTASGANGTERAARRGRHAECDRRAGTPAPFRASHANPAEPSGAGGGEKKQRREMRAAEAQMGLGGDAPGEETEGGEGKGAPERRERRRYRRVRTSGHLYQ